MQQDGAGSAGRLSAAEAAIAAEVERRSDDLRRWASFVWDHPELGHQEQRSAAHLADAITADGSFVVERAVAGLPTAFVARPPVRRAPVVAFLAEYDALPALSNVAEPRRAALVPGGAGHGCHHHLLGAASVLAGLVLQRHLGDPSAGTRGSVWIVGCPAEETDGAKVGLLDRGAFAGVDFVVTWHPDSHTYIGRGASLALLCLTATFHGRASHAAMSPYSGRSALDAALLFAHGLEMLREHVPDGARIHYVIVQGGQQPNIVPERAVVEVYLRAPEVDEVERMLQRLLHVARGADQMSWTDGYGDGAVGYRPPTVTVDSAYWPTLHNRRGSREIEAVLAALGPLPFDDRARAEANAYQRAFGVEPAGLDASALGVPEDATVGSSDVGDVSWNAPLVELNAVTLPMGIPVHSWAAVAAGKCDFAFQGAVRAAQAMAILGYRYLSDAALRREIVAEFTAATGAVRWRSLAGRTHTLTPEPARPAAAPDESR